MNTEMIEQDFIPSNVPKVYVIANSGKEALQAQEQIERKGGIRLTSGMRDSIVIKALEHKFQKSGEALDKLELKLGHRAMVAAFGHAVLAQLAKIGPPYAYVNCDAYGDPQKAHTVVIGTKVSWRVGPMGYAIALRVTDPLPLSVGHVNSKYFTVKAGDLADAIIKWSEDIATWKKERDNLRNKLYAMINTVTTYNSLVKTWPAGKKFWEHIPLEFPFRNQVPAVLVDALNEELGI